MESKKKCAEGERWRDFRRTASPTAGHSRQNAVLVLTTLTPLPRVVVSMLLIRPPSRKRSAVDVYPGGTGRHVCWILGSQHRTMGKLDPLQVWDRIASPMMLAYCLLILQSAHSSQDRERLESNTRSESARDPEALIFSQRRPRQQT